MSKKYDLNTVVRGCITIGVAYLLYLLVRRLSGVLLPFAISWFIAYMLNPMVEWFQVKGHLRRRSLAVAATILTVLLGMVLCFMLVVPPMIEQIVRLKVYVAAYVQSGNYIEVIPDAFEDQFRGWVATIDVSSLLQDKDVHEVLISVMPRVWDVIYGGLSVLGRIVVFFLCCLYVIFILLDFHDLSKKWVTLVPVRYRPYAREMMSDLTTGMNSYFRSQALISIIVGALFAIGFTIIGLPMGIALGMMIAVMNMVPYLHSLSVIPCLLLGMLQSAETGRPYWVILLSIAAVYLVVQTTLDLYLTPKIMGKAMSLHPAIILLSLSIWGSLFGVLGMIIALPMTTLIISYYKRYIIEKPESI